MKKPVTLSPTIEHIERRLLGISDGLIEAVHRGEMSPAISEAVRKSPEWAAYQADMQEEAAGSEPITGKPEPPPALSDAIIDFIQRRATANTLTQSSRPASGHIIRVGRIVTPRPGQMDAVMMAPLHVLLDEPAEAPAVWHGWLVSGETDYAGWWDFVLQEQDAPFDPEAAMVQVWNPVRLYLPMKERFVGQLSAARLQAVRSLAADFVATEQPGDIPVWLGRVASRTTATGLRVTTGSPLGNAQDPRHRYQEIYFEVAEAIREPARLALREMAAVPQGKLGALLSQLISAAGRAAEILLPEPRVAAAMGTEGTTDVPDLSWPGVARFRIVRLTESGTGEMAVTPVGAETVTVEVHRNGLLDDAVSVPAGQTETITWDSGDVTLVFLTSLGRRMELTLRDDD